MQTGSLCLLGVRILGGRHRWAGAWAGARCTYIEAFERWFNHQNEAAQLAYRRRYPAPLYWWHFYSRFWGRGDVGCTLGLLLSLRLFRPSPDWPSAQADQGA